MFIIFNHDFRFATAVLNYKDLNEISTTLVMHIDNVLVVVVCSVLYPVNIIYIFFRY